MQNILWELQELGIELVIADTEGDGFYLPDCKTIVASSKLAEEELKDALLHELKHVLSHVEYAALYQASFSARSKMENEANVFMIKERIKEHEGFYNYTNLLETYCLGLGSEETFKKQIAY